MPQEEITPVSNEELRRRMAPLKSVTHGGPLVYELSDEYSKNGADPSCKDKEGICVRPER